MPKTATKVVAYPVFIAAMIVIWGGHIIITIASLGAIVGAFIDGGILVGLISIPFISIGYGIVRFIWSLVTLPLAALGTGAMVAAGGEE